MSDVKRLAVEGGNPLFPEGPPPWPLADHEVQAALLQVYAEGDWGRYHGRAVGQLADALVEFHGIEHAYPVCSGTFAVELALRVAGVRAGDEVVLAGYDFSGNFRAIEAIGARPVLVDVHAGTACLDRDQLADACHQQTRAVIVSHLHGELAPMADFRALADRLGLLLIEDACQAPGAMVEGRMAGTWGDLGVLSFGGSKLLTAGRGGALLTRSAEFIQRAKVFCEQGNHAFPLSELQAAVLIPQLAKLRERNARRQQNAARLLVRIRGLPGLRPLANGLKNSSPAYYKLGLHHVAEELGGRTREEFIQAVQAEGLAVDAGFRGFARRSERRCRKSSDLPHSKSAADSMLVLHHPVLLEPDAVIDRVADCLEKVCRAWA